LDFAAFAFDPAATRAADFAGGVLANAPPIGRRVAFLGSVLRDFLGVVFDVFLRVFLDIRLPFVAFGGQSLGTMRVLS